MSAAWSRISDYALLGNCRTAALVSNRGSIDWGCFPKFDSPSYFARLLDPEGGHFSLTPVQPFESKQSYIDGTNVLKNRFQDATSAATLTDFISVKRPTTHPNELWPDEEILRILEVEYGEMEFCLDFSPRAGYGRRKLKLKKIGKWGIKAIDGRKHFLLQTNLKGDAMKLENGSAKTSFRVRAGEQILISLSYAEEAPAVMPPLKTALERLEHTIDYWKNWSEKNRYSGWQRRLIERSALVLKLLNFAPSGAFIAAPTTSLPEWIGGGRNWDYRFCWLRDSAFTMHALLSLGYLEEAKSFLNWLLHTTRLTWPRLQVLYTVYGESKVTENVATWLDGFQGSKPVRIGNEASTQVQLDVYGEVIDSLYSLSEFLHPIDNETRKMVTGFGNAVAKLWRKPDHGIWEYRRKPMHYTHSKVMCWVAMDRLAKLSARFGWRLPYDAKKIAFEIREDIEAKGYDLKLKTYTRAYGESALDASLLVMPLVGYCEANSPRFLSTRDAIIRNLSKNDLIYRYPQASDGMTEPEGAFTLCNFWLAETFAKAGDLDGAKKWFNAATSSLSQTLLSSEEIAPEKREPLGNYPQGFSHIGLINAILSINALERKAA